ncbi:ubiquitin-protein ligase [Lithospermum erythrorhizon]|uniref:Ubiquitin-protein ligase n=1 Tax=Lithospermum erythrorhizon TaxID=34254 RepID=A0AAV3R4R5_LITER
MVEADREVMKAEMMKSYIWLQTTDGSIQEVEQEIATFCPLICQEMHSGLGTSKTYPISLPDRVNPAMLSLIIDYCRFHQAPGRSNKERKVYDEKFIRMDSNRLCELTSAADSLQLKPLVDLTSRALARIIEGKSPEEIRGIFHIPDDLTEEEKLEPLKNTMEDSRIRLLNRLYARKRKELKERENLKNAQNEEECVDNRPLDDLLSFINGGNGDSKGATASKSKKKNRKKKDQQKNAHEDNNPSNNISFCNAIDNDKKKTNGHDPSCPKNKLHGLSFPILSQLKLQDTRDINFAPEHEFDDSDLDDEIDPAMKEKIDREVEDFARRLNSDWPERMQEILCLGQEKRHIPMSMNGNDASVKLNPKIKMRSEVPKHSSFI